MIARDEGKTGQPVGFEACESDEVEIVLFNAVATVYSSLLRITKP